MRILVLKPPLRNSSIFVQHQKFYGDMDITYSLFSRGFFLLFFCASGSYLDLFANQLRPFGRSFLSIGNPPILNPSAFRYTLPLPFSRPIFFFHKEDQKVKSINWNYIIGVPMCLAILHCGGFPSSAQYSSIDTILSFSVLMNDTTWKNTLLSLG